MAITFHPYDQHHHRRKCQYHQYHQHHIYNIIIVVIIISTAKQCVGCACSVTSGFTTELCVLVDSLSLSSVLQGTLATRYHAHVTSRRTCQLGSSLLLGRYNTISCFQQLAARPLEREVCCQQNAFCKPSFTSWRKASVA